MTAILINGQRLVVANVGDSRAVVCKNGVAKQLSVDHEPGKEKRLIESRGGFVSNIPGTSLLKFMPNVLVLSFTVVYWFSRKLQLTTIHKAVKLLYRTCIVRYGAPCEGP